MLEATANWASIAIGNARQHENIQQRFLESQTMAIIIQALTETLDLEEVLQLIGESAGQVIPSVERTVIHLLDDETQALWPTVAIGLDELGQPGFNLRVGEGIAGVVIAQGTTINVGDINADSRYLPLGKSSHLQSLMVAPVHSRQRRLGTISVQSADVDAFSLEDERMITTLGFQAAVAIENARLFEAERQRSAELETLRQASLHFTSTLELQPILETILSYALKLVAADDVHIFPYDGERLTFGAALWAGEHQPEPYSEPRPGGLTYNVARKGERIVVPDFEDHPLFQDQSWRGAIIGLPLRFGDEVRGVMNVAFDEPHVFDENELRILELLADQAAVALENARLFEAERQHAASMAALVDVIAAVNASVDFTQTQEVILRHVARVCEAYRATLYLFNESDQLLPVSSHVAYGEAGVGSWDDFRANAAKVGLETIPAVQALLAGETPVILDGSEMLAQLPGELIDSYSTTSLLAAPVVASGRPLGCLVLDNIDPERHFLQRHVDLVKTIANQLGISIEKTRLFEAEHSSRKEAEQRAAELRARERHLSLLNKITRTTLEARPFQEMIQNIADQLGEVINADGCYIAFWDETRGLTIPVAAYGDLKEIYPTYKSEPGQVTLTGSVLKAGRPIAVPDMSNSPYVDPSIVAKFPARSALGLPLFVGDQKLGAAIISFDNPHDFTTDEITRSEQAAGQVSLAIAKAKLLEETQRQFSELFILHAVAAAGTEANNEDELIERVTQIIGDKLYVDNFGVLIVDEDTGDLYHHPSYRGADPVDIPRGKGITGRVAESGQPQRIPDVSREPTYVTVDSATRSELCVPLIVGEQIIGVVNAESTQLNAFTDADERLLVTIAGQLATAIEKLHLFEASNQRAERLAALVTSATAVSASLEIDQVLKIVAKQMAELLNMEACAISIWDREEDIVILQVEHAPDDWKIESEWYRPFKLADYPLTRRVLTQSSLVQLRIDDPNLDSTERSFMEQAELESLVMLPLVARDQTIGLAELMDSWKTRSFSEQEIELLQTLASQVAVAIENARLFEAERARRQEAETLREATTALTLTIETKQVLDRILIHLEKVVPFDSAACVLSAPGDQWHVVAGRGFPEMDQVVDRYYDAYSDELAQEIVRTVKPLILADAQSDPRFEQRGHTDYVRGWMCVPLIMRGEAIGYITIDNKEVGAYGPSEAALAQAFANQAAVAIENARLYNTTRELADRLMVLHQASQDVIGASTDPEDIYRTVHEAAAQLMPCEAFAIFILDEEAQEIGGVYLMDREGRSPAMRIPVSAGLSGHIIKTGCPVLVYDLDKTGQLDGVDVVHYGSPDPVRALIAVPMRVGDKIIGSLFAQSYLPHQYTPEDQLLLEMLAAHAAVALDNARLFEDTNMRLKEVNTLYQIIQEVVASLDVDEILVRVVNSLQEDFGYYHVHVYLFDDEGEMLVVREGSGMVGAQLKEQGHGLPLEQGVVGQVAKTGQIIMSNDVDDLEFFFRNPLLPDTSAELAVPLGYPLKAGQQR